MRIMASFVRLIKQVLAAMALLVSACPIASAQTEDVEGMLAQLADPETVGWEDLERRIVAEWSRSGSASMDFLLRRGKEALEAGEPDVALQHLGALTDHAPEFAEGWHLRAVALYGSNLYGPALEDVMRVLELNPRHFGAMAGFAAILQQLGRDEEALEAWRQVHAMHPHRETTRATLETLSSRVEGRGL